MLKTKGTQVNVSPVTTSSPCAGQSDDAGTSRTRLQSPLPVRRAPLGAAGPNTRGRTGASICRSRCPAARLFCFTSHAAWHPSLPRLRAHPGHRMLLRGRALALRQLQTPSAAHLSAPPRGSHGRIPASGSARHESQSSRYGSSADQTRKAEAGVHRAHAARLSRTTPGTAATRSPLLVTHGSHDTAQGLLQDLTAQSTCRAPSREAHRSWEGPGHRCLCLRDQQLLPEVGAEAGPSEPGFKGQALRQPPPASARVCAARGQAGPSGWGRAVSAQPEPHGQWGWLTCQQSIWGLLR